MCGRARIRNHNQITPSVSSNIITNSGEISGVWGFNKGEWYNVRSEKLNSLYKNYKRGYIILSSFCEGKGEFNIIPESEELIIPVVYNDNNEFAIITRNAVGIVISFHHRMPIIIDNGYNWIKYGILGEIDYNKLKQVA